MIAAIFPSLISKVLDSPDKRKRSGFEWYGITIHHTGTPKELPKEASAWARYADNIAAWLTKRDDAYVSAHFQVNRDGSVVQLVDPDNFEAFHAGKSSFWHPGKRAIAEDWNRYAVGIELVGDGNLVQYTPEQYKSLATLCRALMERYPTIHPLAIVGHEHIAPGRKSDPGFMFDWRTFYRALYQN
jgi:N-acetyl-anhydromuramyl-L-alanine amidase AmpD